ncbi:uncharacterized protein LOC116938747 isoform X1 [Petromyzon marinus]|uniref:uncharacterized protein LOC116938747 isoform X1 n=1 Tax=Petromyzon marinus TaxID=7757 RepID=UPI003F715AF9
MEHYGPGAWESPSRGLGMTAAGHGGVPRPEKVDQAQALARSCAGGPGFQQCDRGFATCAIHTHGKCCKLHWSCHMGWCHCKYVYQRMTPVEQLPSTVVPSGIMPERTPVCSLLISPSRSPCGARATMGGGGVDASRAAAAAAGGAAAGIKQAILSEGFKIRRVNGTLCYVQHLLLSPRCTSAYMVLDGGFADSTPICGRGWRQQQQQQPLASLIVSPCSSPCSGSGSAGESADSGMPASPDSAEGKRSDAEEETEGEGDEGDNEDDDGGGGDENDDDTCSLQSLASGVGLGGEMPQLRANRMRGISEVVDVIETTV